MPLSSGGTTSCTATEVEPIMIGDSLLVTGDFQADSEAWDIFHLTYGTAWGGLSVRYQVIDANGNPVEVIIAPEPATLALLFGGVAMIALRRCRRARLSPSTVKLPI